MDYFVLEMTAKKALSEGKYLSIRYNGYTRDVYPISFRDGLNGVRMYAWCSAHPTVPAESFTVALISDAYVSSADAYVVPNFIQEIGVLEQDFSFGTEESPFY